ELACPGIKHLTDCGSYSSSFDHWRPRSRRHSEEQRRRGALLEFPSGGSAIGADRTVRPRRSPKQRGDGRSAPNLAVESHAARNSVSFLTRMRANYLHAVRIEGAHRILGRERSSVLVPWMGFTWMRLDTVYSAPKLRSLSEAFSNLAKPELFFQTRRVQS